MTLVGSNMTAVCAELQLPIAQLGMYAMTIKSSFTVYEVEDTNTLINIPKGFLESRNAWFSIPSIYRGVYPIELWHPYIVAGRKIKCPVLSVNNDNMTAGAGSDIMTFIQVRYKFVDLKEHKWNLLYTIASENNKRLISFIKTFARKW